MPELPDVEGFRRHWNRHAAGERVARVSAARDMVRNTTPQGLGRLLKGKQLGEAGRLGKWLVCPADGAFLVLHFGMTGLLVSSEEEPERHPHDRLILSFATGAELRYRNMRKLGGAWSAAGRRDLDVLFEDVGPDALRVDAQRFVDMAARRRGGAKTALMDQRFLAGPGNLVVDETLWRAGIHPTKQLRALGEGGLRELHTALHGVLEESLPYGRVPARRSWLLGVRGSAGAPCPRCGAPIKRTVVGGRTTYYCSRCQPP
ncbi:MAG: Fpg/Nei family DNA glycosylase [Actinomycetota bacterium]